MLVLLQISNAMLWLSFAPIVGIFQDYYQCDVRALSCDCLYSHTIKIDTIQTPP